MGLGEKTERAALLRASGAPGLTAAGVGWNFTARLAINSDRFYAGKRTPRVREGYSRIFADTAGRRADLAGGRRDSLAERHRGYREPGRDDKLLYPVLYCQMRR